jgi:hypothetical protein
MKEIVNRYDIEAKISDYRLTTHFGINQFASMEEDDQPEPAYLSYFSIVLNAEIIEPNKKKGYILELDATLSDSDSEMHKSTISEWVDWAKRQKKEFERPNPIGYIDRARNRRIPARLFLPARLETSILTSLNHCNDNCLYLGAEKLKAGRGRIYTFVIEA